MKHDAYKWRRNIDPTIEPLSRFIACERLHDEESPFNLVFKSVQPRGTRSPSILGTALYLLVFDGQVIYIGKYRPVQGDIVSDRWRRHLQTVTARGRNIGLGGSDPSTRLEQYLEAVLHPGLQQILKNVHDSDHQRKTRFRDTGYTSTPNRLRFASIHWDHFSTADHNTILERFKIIHVAMRPAASQKIADEEISVVEKYVLSKVQPLCNKEYRHSLHAGQPAIQVSTALEWAKSSMHRFTGRPPLRCVLLDGSI